MRNMTKISAQGIICGECNFSNAFHALEVASQEIRASASIELECVKCGSIIVFEYNVKMLNGKKLYRDPEWLTEQYVVESRTIASIAFECAVSPMTIWGWLAKHGIETRSRGRR